MENNVKKEKMTEESKKEKSPMANEVVETIYKRASELSKEEILALPRYAVELIENKKNGKRNFTYKIALGDRVRLNADAKSREYFDNNEWELIKLIYGSDGSFIKKLPMRFIKGVGSNGKVYYRWQLFITPEIIKSGFFDNATLTLIKALENNDMMEKLIWNELSLDVADEDEIDKAF